MHVIESHAAFTANAMVFLQQIALELQSLRIWLLMHRYLKCCRMDVLFGEVLARFQTAVRCMTFCLIGCCNCIDRGNSREAAHQLHLPKGERFDDTIAAIDSVALCHI